MAWRTPAIVLSREAVAQYVNPELWDEIGFPARRRIAPMVAEQSGEQGLALALLQGNPNLTDIQMESEFPLQG